MMKTEEELFIDFINEYHSHDAMDIASDPLLYIYWWDSTDFACYKFRCAVLDLRDALFATFKVNTIMNALIKVLNKIVHKENNK